jgi:glucosyl-3-phosphoglycerate synthase
MYASGRRATNDDPESGIGDVGRPVSTVHEDERISRIMRLKGDRRISLCFPCRDEGETVGRLLAEARVHLVDEHRVLDELVVLDDNSTDDTAARAEAAGATVIPISLVHDRHGAGRGKGNALWASLVATQGDFIVWCDGDVTSFRADWILRLVEPLLVDDDLALVKAAYHRPEDLGGGGRTTELVARPLLSLFEPALARLDQPLAGEYAGRRHHLERIPFMQGWGAEVAMLIDLARRFGPDCITQADLGVRHHRHHPLRTLSIQAAEVTGSLLIRQGLHDHLEASTLIRDDGSEVALNFDERPPVASLALRS